LQKINLQFIAAHVVTSVVEAMLLM